MGACMSEMCRSRPMLRIRGSIGDWPVDLTLELDDSDWARLGAQLQVSKTEEASAPAAKPVNQDEALWQIAKDLLRKAGQLSGPDLLEQLHRPAPPKSFSCRPTGSRCRSP